MRKEAKEIAAEVKALGLNREDSILLAAASGIRSGWQKHIASLEPETNSGARAALEGC